MPQKTITGFLFEWSGASPRRRRRRGRAERNESSSDHAILPCSWLPKSPTQASRKKKLHKKIVTHNGANSALLPFLVVQKFHLYQFCLEFNSPQLFKMAFFDFLAFFDTFWCNLLNKVIFLTNKSILFIK